eukprot:352467-Chlamydomonas_euryale.AAC.5
MRSGGGLGESSTSSTHASVGRSDACPGNSEATWPSGPMPNSIKSNTGKPASLRGSTDVGRAAICAA